MGRTEAYSKKCLLGVSRTHRGYQLSRFEAIRLYHHSSASSVRSVTPACRFPELSRGFLVSKHFAPMLSMVACRLSNRTEVDGTGKAAVVVALR